MTKQRQHSYKWVANKDEMCGVKLNNKSIDSDQLEKVRIIKLCLPGRVMKMTAETPSSQVILPHSYKPSSPRSVKAKCRKQTPPPAVYLCMCVCFTCISVKLGADCVLCRISRLCNNRLSSVRLDWQRASSGNKMYTHTAHKHLQHYVS